MIRMVERATSAKSVHDARRALALTLAAPMLVLSSCASVVALPQAEPDPPGAHAPARGEPVTLDLIMQDPTWVARPPERPFWSEDGGRIYYWRTREGQRAASERGWQDQDLHEVDPATGATRVLSDAERAMTGPVTGDWSADLSRRVYSRGGDLFLKVEGREATALTRTGESEDSPSFMGDGRRIQFRRGGQIIIRDLETGVEEQAADVRAAKDPDLEKKADRTEYLQEQQDRLFQTIRERREARDQQQDRQRDLRKADPRRLEPFFIGDDVDIRQMELSPDGRWLAVRVAVKGGAPGKQDTMPVFVTESGYVETRQVRAKVGTPKPAPERLILLDLQTRARHDVALGDLPGVSDDPLAEVKADARAFREEQAKKKEPPTEVPLEATPEEAKPEQAKPAEKQPDKDTPKEDRPKDRAPEEKPQAKAGPRGVSLSALSWSDSGTHLLFQAFSHDHKDRWVCTVNVGTDEKPALTCHRRVSDQAWINGRFADIGWLRDSSGFYYTSEDTGFSHLYVQGLDGSERRAITSGRYEVDSPALTRDGRFIYFTANASHPGVTEVWRAEVATGTLTRATTLGGMVSFALSPDGQRVAVLHSEALRPNELFWVEARADGSFSDAARLTRTVTERFAAIPWSVPEFVEIPRSGAADGGTGNAIFARVYEPAGAVRDSRPLVLFLHGAGYLQNAHKGWSNYSREFMFHTMLVERGYVVIDMDFRASAGYGRDWRTAIYRVMGAPEVQDMRDAIAWATAELGVDPSRVGVYGGSYGGFLTLYAMLRAPEVFACGAALRPVTDWAHYNDGYTANILNTPDIDPRAYFECSPIEHAHGLSRPLLICHGMLDDNVLYMDSVRLAQRFIELGKSDWELAGYPMESHAFVEPSSWVDEYRRILTLFERHLKPR